MKKKRHIWIKFSNILITVPTMVGDEENFAILEALNCLFQNFSVGFSTWQDQFSMRKQNIFPKRKIYFILIQNKGALCHRGPLPPLVPVALLGEIIFNNCIGLLLGIHVQILFNILVFMNVCLCSFFNVFRRIFFQEALVDYFLKERMLNKKVRALLFYFKKIKVGRFFNSV